MISSIEEKYFTLILKDPCQKGPKVSYLITDDEKITYSREEIGRKAVNILQTLPLNSFHTLRHTIHILKETLIKNIFHTNLIKETKQLIKNK